MKHFESYLYSKLSAYDPMVRILDKEDVMQEIRFAILTAEEGELFRVASSLIRRLARDFGYSRRKGKDNFEAFYRENAIPYDPAQEALLQEVEDLYLTGDMTAREIAQHYNIKFNNALAKMLCEVFQKAMGRGGIFIKDVQSQRFYPNGKLHSLAIRNKRNIAYAELLKKSRHLPAFPLLDSTVDNRPKLL